MNFVNLPRKSKEENPMCCTTNSICNGCFDDGCLCVDANCTVCYASPHS